MKVARVEGLYTGAPAGMGICFAGGVDDMHVLKEDLEEGK
jgi:hypothetical protein